MSCITAFMKLHFHLQPVNRSRYGLWPSSSTGGRCAGWPSSKHLYYCIGGRLHGAGGRAYAPNTKCSSDLASCGRTSCAVRRLVSHREERLVKRYGCDLDGLALTGTAVRQLHYPVDSAPGCRDGRWLLFLSAASR